MYFERQATSISGLFSPMATGNANTLFQWRYYVPLKTHLHKFHYSWKQKYRNIMFYVYSEENFFVALLFFFGSGGNLSHKKREKEQKLYRILRQTASLLSFTTISILMFRSKNFPEKHS